MSESESVRLVQSSSKPDEDPKPADEGKSAATTTPTSSKPENAPKPPEEGNSTATTVAAPLMLHAAPRSAEEGKSAVTTPESWKQKLMWLVLDKLLLAIAAGLVVGIALERDKRQTEEFKIREAYLVEMSKKKVD